MMPHPTIPIALIAAVAENNVIGVNGGMPWHISSDLKYFRKMTIDKPVVMGAGQFDSMARPLDRRANIVLTRDRSRVIAGAHVVHAIDAALALGRALARQSEAREVMVIGGGEIYAQTMQYAARLYITRVHASIPGDTYFPPVDTALWSIVASEEIPARGRDTIDCTRLVYARNASSRAMTASG